MSKLNRLIGMAQKALDKNGSSSSSGSTDWRGIVRSAASTLTGDARPQQQPEPAWQRSRPTQPAPRSTERPQDARPGASASEADRQAIARYDYLLQTAEPQQIEQVHQEAFARLTPQQRAQIEARMREELPPHEQPRSADAPDLARAATRAEMGKPGMLKGLLARVGGGRGVAMGAAGVGVGALAGGALAAVAGGAILSSVAGPLLASANVDFDALAGGLDLEGIGFEGFEGVEGITSGLGEQVSGFGEQISNLEIPGLGDILGR
ncbi:cation-transporting ATPase [Microbacteriaceae bacterium VKM Ac-2854]|nr:cation-transporting ATPase [Microbacteriaceae bacterium VKM Ac-2854]